ncbi:MAG: alpha/beta fold hydrolase [Caulobacterales bacterium]
MRLLIKILVILAVVLVASTAVGCVALRRGDIPYATLQERYGFENSQYADLGDGLRVHFREQGPKDAPVLLLLHGFSASTNTWVPWSNELSDTFRVVSLDLPGHGLTEAPANYRASIEAFVDLVDRFAAKENLNRFTLVGSSMGGHVAWEYGLAHAERLDGLVLVAAAGWWDDRIDRSNRPVIFQLLNNPVLGPMLRDLDTTAMARQGLQASFANPALATEQMVRRYVELSRGPGHRDILLQMTLAARDRVYATPERLAPLNALPVLILHGEKDNLVPVQYGRRFHEALPASQLQTWPNVGHLPQEEIADQSAAVLRAFLLARVHPELAPPAPVPVPPETPVPATPHAAAPAAQVLAPAAN